jgi:hypothetical protein
VTPLSDVVLGTVVVVVEVVVVEVEVVLTGAEGGGEFSAVVVVVEGAVGVVVLVVVVGVAVGLVVVVVVGAVAAMVTWKGLVADEVLLRATRANVSTLASELGLAPIRTWPE